MGYHVGGEVLMAGAGDDKKIVDGRPVSFAATLDGLANWMDRVDRILVRRGEIGKPSSGKVQADLRRAARALRLDPMLDDLVMDAMLHGPETDLPDETELF
jgi:hypothetical protein